jgi:aryl-alcohol dehydrogenase-like predicted oxidoreductase
MAAKYLNERGFSVLAALDAVAEAQNTTPAAVALAWLIAQPGITAAIASATSGEQLDNLIEATRLSLDRTAIEKLNAASE